MTTNDIYNQIIKKKSFLCVGLDSEFEKIPSILKTAADPVYEFNKNIVDATANLAIAYKPNLAFYESRGLKGWESLEKTVFYIKEKYPEIFVIADAKRGDIGNTSKMYAKAFFETLPFDAITVAPYMGEDSVTPFLQYKDKFVIVLALTSNTGASDFQFISDIGGGRLFEKVLKVAKTWAGEEQIMYVVGATRAEMLADVRKIVPGHFLLIPGIGAQGGSLEDVVIYGINNRCGLIVNSSRGIIFADSTRNFASAACQEAEKLQNEMELLLNRYLK